ncbi:MAG: GNAT family N-acetyltransferase [Angelakisella sp.]
MSIKTKHYNDAAGYSVDFRNVCNFLIRINQNKVITPNYLWARWVWQFGPYMNMENLSKIGVFQDDDTIVGLVTYENDIGEAYFCLDEAYAYLKPQLIEYASKHLSLNGKIKIAIPDGDLGYQKAAINKGFYATNEKSSVARIDIADFNITLPNGYSIISFDNPGFNVDKYYASIWKGFDNQRERNEMEMQSMKKREGFDAPFFDKSLRVIIVAPNGEYASHCGMWYIPGSTYAYVEPVFTLPEYRKMGLGKAAVLEGVKRCGKLGAEYAIVLSSQQFYYSIGFYPTQNETWWKYKTIQ